MHCGCLQQEAVQQYSSPESLSSAMAGEADMQCNKKPSCFQATNQNVNSLRLHQQVMPRTTALLCSNDKHI